MEDTVFRVVVFIGSVCGILSLILLVIIGVFLVKLRDRMREFLSDLVQVVAAIGHESDEVVQPSKKTWDEKYEEALAEFEELRRRESGGLVDPVNNYAPAQPPRGSFEDGLTKKE